MEPRARRIWTRSSLIGLILLLPIGLWYLSQSRYVQLAGAFVRRVVVADSVIALTLDDGPTTRYTAEVLALLRAHHVRATFFLVGENIARAPEAARAIAAAGHELGNHSYSHLRMVFHSRAFYRTEVERTDSLLHQAGAADPILFRPPFGVRLLGLPLYLRKTNRTTVLWDIQPDWAIGPDSAEIVNQVLSRVRPGSIILLHVMFDSRSDSRRALPGLILALQARGYRFLTVSELLRRGRGGAGR